MRSMDSTEPSAPVELEGRPTDKDLGNPLLPVP